MLHKNSVKGKSRKDGMDTVDGQIYKGISNNGDKSES